MGQRPSTLSINIKRLQVIWNPSWHSPQILHLPLRCPITRHSPAGIQHGDSTVRTSCAIPTAAATSVWRDIPIAIPLANAGACLIVVHNVNPVM